MAIILPTPKDREIIFNEQVDQTTIGKLSKSILEINADDEYISKLYALHGLTYNPTPIKIYIDSFGGSVYQCFGLLGIMENSKIPIHTITTGCAMSAGFMIAITGHERYAYDKATFMYHQLSDVAFGNLKEMEDNIVESQRLQDMIEKHTKIHTKITPKKLKEVYKEKTDWYMTAKEALKLGVVDIII
jgi:ATP-dependent Clp protease protease subunit